MYSKNQQDKLIENELDKSLALHNCASARDCTGTVAMNPETEEGIESYDEVYHFEPILPKKLKKL